MIRSGPWSAAMGVGGWLRSLGLGQCEALFRASEIDADILRRRRTTISFDQDASSGKLRSRTAGEMVDRGSPAGPPSAKTSACAAEKNPERRDHRRALQPAAARCRRNHVTPAVDNIDVARSLATTPIGVVTGSPIVGSP